MEKFSFVHTADLHIDSTFKGISEINDRISSELISATFKTFNRIVDLCIEKQATFLLITGDIYDGTDRSLRAQLRFLDGLKRLSEADIQAFIVHGNHDPLDGWSANLDWPKNVHIFKGNTIETISVIKDGEEIAKISGTSFPKRKIEKNLAKEFPKIPKSGKDLFTIGMLHCNVGTNTGHEPYASCSLQDLISKNFDYWALGHVHSRTILNDAHPLIVYPGNPQGLNPKEIGCRGCYLISVDVNGETETEFFPMDSIRWFVEELSINSLDTEQKLIFEISNSIELVRKNAEGRSSICRIVLTGRGNLYPAIARKGFLDEILQEVRDCEEGETQFVWVESLINKTKPEVDRKQLLERRDFIGDLARSFEESYRDKQQRENLKEFLDPLIESPSGRKFLESYDDEEFIEILRRAEAICLDELMDESSHEI